MRPRKPARLPPGFIVPCAPVLSPQPPVGPRWIHEIKHDGYRLLVRRSGDTVKLYTRKGFDWTERYRLIVESARAIKAKSFLIDGEAVVCDKNGVADFAKLHSRCFEHQVMLYGFDLLELDGSDMRAIALEDRKAQLAKLLRKPKGIHFNEHIDAEGATIFRHACKLGLEGIISKRRDLGYKSGNCTHWLKIKNPRSPAMLRYEENGSW